MENVRKRENGRKREKRRKEKIRYKEEKVKTKLQKTRCVVNNNRGGGFVGCAENNNSRGGRRKERNVLFITTSDGKSCENPILCQVLLVCKGSKRRRLEKVVIFSTIEFFFIGAEHAIMAAKKKATDILL
ncbi:hypothetical protein [Subdoligranulum variabile]|uniref:Uncharacterized protein n=1 Tax=Subdoligranulum variabile DSM 15176 TaxID=411471 RepID=D1PMT6_9FIRM|nr:hypothetical protein [Subdoligranulum variabile]EFB75871.1 hypothetical protein SUBVAR_05650 [Subdoligranulum variabile DSM 15176]UWP68541.1 hypothetical protein NQ490_01445 [Subdoligranulum variabile]